MLLEADIERIAQTNPARLVGLYLMASYLYYCNERHDPILSDNAYDLVCVRLADHWPHIEHRHKHLIQLEEGKVASNFTMRPEDYPLIVQNTAIRRSRYPQEFVE